MTVRVYVPSTSRRLRMVVETGGIGPAPIGAHAVTATVRSDLSDAVEEEWEHAAASAAAQSSVAMLEHDEPARRVVLAVDVPAWRDVEDAADPTLVEVEEAPLRRLAAVLVDSADAEHDVAAARDAVAAGAARTDVLLERCLDHEPGWWAAQEVDELLEDLGGR